MTFTAIRFTVTAVPAIIAEGIHAVLPRIRSRYTVHAVAVSLMSAGFKMGHNEHLAIEWFTIHYPRVISFLVDIGWEPMSELLTGVGMAPYLDHTAQRLFDALRPIDKCVTADVKQAEKEL